MCATYLTGALGYESRDALCALETHEEAPCGGYVVPCRTTLELSSQGWPRVVKHGHDSEKEEHVRCNWSSSKELRQSPYLYKRLSIHYSLLKVTR